MKMTEVCNKSYIKHFTIFLLGMVVALEKKENNKIHIVFTLELSVIHF